MAKRGFGRLFASVAMSCFSLAIILPLIIMVLTSFKSEKEVLEPSSVLPHTLSTINYTTMVQSAAEAPVGLWGVNSVFISCSATLLVAVVSTMAAFAIARVRVKGSERFLTLIVGTMMVPPQLLLIPLYVILDKLHMIDSPSALIFPACAGGFGVFMLTSYMRSLPASLEEAALIDGCNWGQVFLRVTVPLCGPAIATLCVFTFIGTWNDYLTPLVFMEKVVNYTLPVGIALFQSSYSTQYGLTLATSVVATLPLLVIFVIFQRQIISSMSASGLKD